MRSRRPSVYSGRYPRCSSASTPSRSPSTPTDASMRLPASLRAGLCALGLMVGASGVVWLFAREGSRRLALACMQVHGSAAMALLVVIGAVAALHAPVG